MKTPNAIYGLLQARFAVAQGILTLLLLAAFAALLPARLQAQGALTIDQLSYGGGSVTIQFTDRRLATNPVLNHAVEFSR